MVVAGFSMRIGPEDRLVLERTLKGAATGNTALESRYRRDFTRGSGRGVVIVSNLNQLLGE